MIGNFKRVLAVIGLTVLLGACQVIPDDGAAPQTSAPPVVTQPTAPEAGVLPTDAQRHRVALLVPLTGENAAVGQSISNATTMALLDTGAENLRITTYDTNAGAAAAAARAVADGNKLILGPLMGENVGPVLGQARPANVPLISFSNDAAVARPDVFVAGHIPGQSIARTVNFAVDQGARRFAALIPEGVYGDTVLAALQSAAQARGAQFTGFERFARGNRSIVSAAARLAAKGGFDTVLIADGARLSAMAARELKDVGEALPSIIGTELWSGEAEVASTPELRGAWFSAVSDYRYGTFAQSYDARFGTQPYRISTLGYDAVLWTLRVAQDWRPGTDFPTGKLLNPAGFIGLDGLLRFTSNGLGERAMEVRQVNNGSISTLDAAPGGF